jgi:putative hydrolase of the HAD superfamily
LKVFDLEKRARASMENLEAGRPWQAFARLRLAIYEKMIADVNVLREHRWPKSIALLERVRKNGFKTALATMSHCREASRVLEALSLRNCFDFVATRDDVERGKPDPEIYLLCASELATPAAECLVIEDSPAGVRAARAAGMDVLAVTTPFTREAFQRESLLDRRWVVDDPEELPTVMWECLLAHQRDTHGG